MKISQNLCKIYIFGLIKTLNKILHFLYKKNIENTPFFLGEEACYLSVFQSGLAAGQNASFTLKCEELCVSDNDLRLVLLKRVPTKTFIVSKIVLLTVLVSIN